MTFDERSAECTWAVAELSDRELAAEAARRLEAHLLVCPSCRQTRDGDRRLAELFAGASFPVTPSGIERRVQVLLGRRQAMRWSVAWRVP